VQSMSRRRKAEGEVAGHTVTNLTLRQPERATGLSISFSVYNLFNSKYADPASSALANLGLDAIPQPGRNFRVKLTYTF